MLACSSVLRQRCGKPEANWRHRFFGFPTHAAASGFLRGGGMARDSFVVSTDATQLRKIFRRNAARRQCFAGHAHKLNDVPEMTANLATA
jgi:hypothetical protein